MEGGLPAKGGTMLEPRGTGGKAATVFDPGPSSSRGGPAEMRGPQPRLSGWLVTFSHDKSGDDYRLREGRNIVGSAAAECEVVVGNDSSVSSKHAVIVFRDGLFQIRDNDSTNGTYVNGEDIFGKGAVPLKNLDKIRLGNTEFVLYTLQP